LNKAKHNFIFFAAFLCLITLLYTTRVFGEDKMLDLKTVEYVDVNRYMGTWYEVSKYPQKFEKGLVGVTATYRLLKNGKVEVLNSGFKDTFEGKIKIAKGKAHIVDKNTNAKLKVTFFWPFYGDYWIIDLGKDYEFAVVGGPNRKYLWILSRTHAMNPEIYNQIIERLKAKGYDISKLEIVAQK
jgi:apolipoprotein D and lipocalin family protein